MHQSFSNWSEYGAVPPSRPVMSDPRKGSCQTWASICHAQCSIRASPLLLPPPRAAYMILWNVSMNSNVRSPHSVAPLQPRVCHYHYKWDLPNMLMGNGRLSPWAAMVCLHLMAVMTLSIWFRWIPKFLPCLPPRWPAVSCFSHLWCLIQLTSNSQVFYVLLQSLWQAAVCALYNTAAFHNSKLIIRPQQ